MATLWFTCLICAMTSLKYTNCGTNIPQKVFTAQYINLIVDAKSLSGWAGESACRSTSTGWPPRNGHADFVDGRRQATSPGHRRPRRCRWSVTGAQPSPVDVRGRSVADSRGRRRRPAYAALSVVVVDTCCEWRHQWRHRVAARLEPVRRIQKSSPVKLCSTRSQIHESFQQPDIIWEHHCRLFDLVQQ